MECIPQKYQSDLEHAGASLSASELWAQLNGWQLLTPDFEPYVLIRAPPESPCDERFQNYGKNKVSFITSLFYRGFRFYGLPREFVFHMTHPKSLSRLTWEKGTRFEVRAAAHGNSTSPSVPQAARICASASLRCSRVHVRAFVRCACCGASSSPSCSSSSARHATRQVPVRLLCCLVPARGRRGRHVWDSARMGL
jgi:hypothetical protein